MQTRHSSRGDPGLDLRLAGNLAFRDGRFDDAECIYTKALDAPDATADRHLLIGNRSALHAAAAELSTPYLSKQRLTGTICAERRCA